MGKMTLLLDTHIFLWWFFDASRLPAGIRLAVEDADNTMLVHVYARFYIFKYFSSKNTQ